MQNLVTLCVLILIAGLTFTVIRWPGGPHMTFSQHAATNRWSKLYYFLLFLVTLPLLMWFFTAWFVPVKHLPCVFLWFAAIGVLFQIACTLFPEEGGSKTFVHRTLTAVSGVALLPLVAIVALSNHFSKYVQLTAWVCLVMMLVLLGIALKNQKGFRYALWLQVGYYAAFLAAVLTATYV